jgi:hypothetical protein
MARQMQQMCPTLLSGSTSTLFSLLPLFFSEFFLLLPPCDGVVNESVWKNCRSQFGVAGAWLPSLTAVCDVYREKRANVEGVHSFSLVDLLAGLRATSVAYYPLPNSKTIVI